jgi:hypothetical protein
VKLPIAAKGAHCTAERCSADNSPLYKQPTPLPERRSGVHSFAQGEWHFCETGSLKLRIAAEGVHCTAERCSADNFMS